MTDVNNMLNAYHWELTAGEYTDGGQTDSLLKIAERVNGLDDAHRYAQTLKISVRCKYECGDVITLTMDARGKLQGNRKSSHAQQILLHYIGK